MDLELGTIYRYYELNIVHDGYVSALADAMKQVVERGLLPRTSVQAYLIDDTVAKYEHLFSSFVSNKAWLSARHDS